MRSAWILAASSLLGASQQDELPRLHADAALLLRLQPGSPDAARQSFVVPRPSSGRFEVVARSQDCDVALGPEGRTLDSDLGGGFEPRSGYRGIYAAVAQRDPSGRPGGETWPKLTLLETMGVIGRLQREREYVRRISFRTRVEPDWSGRCACSQTAPHSAIASITGRRKSLGWGLVKRMRSMPSTASQARSSSPNSVRMSGRRSRPHELTF